MLNPHWNTTSIICDANDIAGQNHHIDLVAVTGERLIDRIVHDLIHQMMQTARAGGTDVHPRTLPNSLQPFQNLYLVFIVCLIRLHDFVYIHFTLFPQ